MGQIEVLDFLEKHDDEWFTCREITERNGISYNLNLSALRKLSVRGFICSKQMKVEGHKCTFHYRYIRPGTDDNTFLRKMKGFIPKEKCTNKFINELV